MVGESKDVTHEVLAFHRFVEDQISTACVEHIGERWRSVGLGDGVAVLFEEVYRLVHFVLVIVHDVAMVFQIVLQIFVVDDVQEFSQFYGVASVGELKDVVNVDCLVTHSCNCLRG